MTDNRPLVTERRNELQPCSNPLCERLVVKGVLFCCGPCSAANDGKYEIHESGRLAHTEPCNERWETRRAL